jgi:hypothetical protein
LPSGSHYLDGELMPGGILVLFDVLQVSQYLIGVSQVDRLEMLADICGNPSDRCDARVAMQVSEHIWMAEHGFNDFFTEFANFAPQMLAPTSEPLVEGLVLRKKQSFLDNYGPRPYDVDWQLRCRYGKKNYRF